MDRSVDRSTQLYIMIGFVIVSFLILLFDYVIGGLSRPMAPRGIICNPIGLLCLRTRFICSSIGRFGTFNVNYLIYDWSYSAAWTLIAVLTNNIAPNSLIPCRAQNLILEMDLPNIVNR